MNFFKYFFLGLSSFYVAHIQSAIVQSKAEALSESEYRLVIEPFAFDFLTQNAGLVYEIKDFVKFFVAEAQEIKNEQSDKIKEIADEKEEVFRDFVQKMSCEIYDNIKKLREKQDAEPGGETKHDKQDFSEQLVTMDRLIKNSDIFASMVFLETLKLQRDINDDEKKLSVENKKIQDLIKTFKDSKEMSRSLPDLQESSKNRVRLERKKDFIKNLYHHLDISLSRLDEAKKIYFEAKKESIQDKIDASEFKKSLSNFIMEIGNKELIIRSCACLSLYESALVRGLTLDKMNPFFLDSCISFVESEPLESQLSSSACQMATILLKEIKNNLQKLITFVNEKLKKEVHVLHDLHMHVAEIVGYFQEFADYKKQLNIFADSVAVNLSNTADQFIKNGYLAESLLQGQWREMTLPFTSRINEYELLKDRVIQEFEEKKIDEETARLDINHIDQEISNHLAYMEANKQLFFNGELTEFNEEPIKQEISDLFNFSKWVKKAQTYFSNLNDLIQDNVKLIFKEEVELHKIVNKTIYHLFNKKTQEEHGLTLEKFSEGFLKHGETIKQWGNTCGMCSVWRVFCGDDEKKLFNDVDFKAFENLYYSQFESIGLKGLLESQLRESIKKVIAKYGSCNTLQNLVILDSLTFFSGKELSKEVENMLTRLKKNKSFEWVILCINNHWIALKLQMNADALVMTWYDSGGFSEEDFKPSLMILYAFLTKHLKVIF